MKSLMTLLVLWRPRLAYLLFGVVIAELSVYAGFLLMGQTSIHLGHAILGTGLSFLLLRLAGVSRIILRYSERLITHDAMFRALSDLRVWFYRRLAHGAAAGLGFRRSADILTRLVADVQSLDNLYLRIFVPLATAGMTLPVIIIFCFRLNNVMALLVGGLFVLIAFILPFLTYRLACRTSPNLLQARSALHVRALDMATGLREARVFSAEEHFATALIHEQENLYKQQKRQGLMMALAHMGAVFLGRLAIIIVLYVCADFTGERSDLLSDSILGITLLLVMMTAFDNIIDLPRAGLSGGEACHAAQRILEIAETGNSSPEGKKDFPNSCDLHLEKVTFGWTAEHIVLKDISLCIPQGTRMALTGPSGSGKSSLAALLLKAARPQAGHILLGNVALDNIADESLRHHIAWLPQSSHLFDDTVRNNLLLGRKNVSDAELWQVLDHAQIGDVIRCLPNGLDHWLGENGSQLSGGQGQRIALARALLSKAPLLILDEPATGLDLDTERAFLQTLNHVAEGRTIILITHRLTGVEKLDYIWRLENGKMMPQPL